MKWINIEGVVYETATLLLDSMYPNSYLNEGYAAKRQQILYPNSKLQILNVMRVRDFFSFWDHWLDD